MLPRRGASAGAHALSLTPPHRHSLAEVHGLLPPPWWSQPACVLVEKRFLAPAVDLEPAPRFSRVLEEGVAPAHPAADVVIRPLPRHEL